MSLEEEKGRKAGGLIISMQGGEKLSLEQIRALLEASQEVRFGGHSREEIYAWVGKTLREQDYAKLGVSDRGQAIGVKHAPLVSG